MASSQAPSTSLLSRVPSPQQLRSMSPEQLRELNRLLTPRMTKYIPHQPFPQQTALLLLPNREALYGGAAGGGKSDALLMAALQYVDVPGYAAILFRRSFMDLNQPDALIPRSKAWLANTDAIYNKQLHEWTFPSGAVLKFGYLEHEDDVYQYQGAAFQFVGWDELTQFSRSQYTYLLSRVRRPSALMAGADPSLEERLEKARSKGAGALHDVVRKRLTIDQVPLRVRSSANPGGRGHEWVKQRFMVEGPTHGRPFIRSKLQDNPFLDRDSYKEGLMELDPIRRAQLLEGNWDVLPEGELFKREWFRIVDESAVPAGLKWVRYWDFAATEVDAKKKNDPDWTAGALVAVQKLEAEGDGERRFARRRIWVRDVRRMRGTPSAVERFVRATAEEDGKSVAIWVEQEPGSSGKTVAEDYCGRVLYGFNARAHKKTGSKIDMWSPISAQAELGNVHLVRAPWNGWWLDEATAAPSPGVHDDGLDAVAGAVDKASVPRVVLL